MISASTRFFAQPSEIIPTFGILWFLCGAGMVVARDVMQKMGAQDTRTPPIRQCACVRDWPQFAQAAGQWAIASGWRSSSVGCRRMNPADEITRVLRFL